MDAWRDIRLKARHCHERALATANGDCRARALVDAALQNADLELRYCTPGVTLGEGVFGSFERSDGLVTIVSGQNPADEVVVIAHEIGHAELHHDPTNDVHNVQAQLGGDQIDSGAGVVEGYSPRERKEVQANIFAGEFLCPADWLRTELVEKSRRPSEIAEELGIPYGLVLNQAIRAVLLPPLREPELQAPSPAIELDESQRIAAVWSGGPLLVDAGPGTGKTRTLVHRIGHLLGTGVLSGSILALTFSNKAAEEMRERLSTAHSDASIEMWVDTFHAFGLEMITKWPGRLGRTANVKILDQTGQLALLETNLSRLPLRHYQNLFEPAYELAYVLQAISRCKDELITPDEYIAEAKAALAQAGPDEQEAAEKALEVGEIYKVYQDLLEDADAVDFGDLVMLTAQLAEKHDDIRLEYQQRFQHILVDEYQDVNFASARLLQILAGGCQDVWVVGDQRQSIYRFRGAEPANVGRFQTDFSGSKLSLTSNYRSGGPVVRAFSEFSRHMAANPDDAASWTAHRGEVGEVSLTVAGTMAEEAAAIRDHIEALRAKGIPYRDQAILARSHLTLSRITGVLERLGVPLLYLGDLFERDDVRDLLSLVAIDAEFGGIGLVRVVQLPEYGATKQDALTVIRWSQDQDVTIYDALARLTEIGSLSEPGRAGMTKLAGHLAGMGPATSPWTLLTTWLFERSDYLRPLLEANDARAQQQLIAIYQFLKVCSEQRPGNTPDFHDPGRAAFLERIRRIESLNQDSRYRAVASEATDFDAVRVMTIHGSKGLEFGGVHLPAIATRYMPTNRQWARCPPPASLSKLTMQKADHDAEEECLFFVGLSRARNYLCLTRAERYTEVNASASKFLDTVSRQLRATKFNGATPPLPSSPAPTPPSPRDTYEERELDIYLRCPARYRYEVINGLRGGRDSSAYLRFHRCVHRTMGWLEQEAQEGRPATLEQAKEELARQWQEHGPVKHGFEGYYRAAAEVMASSIARLITAETGTYDREVWSVQLAAGKAVTYSPDRVVMAADGAVRVQRIRTGRKTKSEADNRVYALIRRGAAQRYPGRDVSVEAYYPTSDESVPMPPKNDDKLLREYVDAIAAIERGAFPAKPSDARQCPNCQCYFICGA